MSSHVGAGSVEGSQVVLERIQVSVMQGTTKQPVALSTSSSTLEKGAETTRSESPELKRQISNADRVWTSLLAGAAAGALAKTTIAPLDRTKINFQISKKPYSAKAAIEFLVQSYTKEGLMSLWRGNSAMMVRIMPYAAIQFTAHEQWKRILKVNGPETDKKKRFLAGSLAGVTSQSLTYPLDLARARMAVTHRDEYKTLHEVFLRIYQREGVSAFYRGFTATILGVIPYAGFSFFTYDTLKQWFAVHAVDSPGLSAMSSLICGALAGVVGQTSSYPLDIVRRRIQTSAVTRTHYHTIYETSVKIYTEEGVMAFFKGLSMNWVKGPVAVGISFATYDTILVTLRKIMC
ncbi:mitochondrial coenzyme A transporter SLC25A42 [Venturia canescens]|uniref:mitochondrial coenzyme A transporter SLC25A42 n=1 Tax=Venturia canescens TaxID=32260 RepID=UPI001C9D265F|nr:mitochondrial coenzyme A transporter SLC25A42 [Venturia canescens]XP_043267261.1 mitochondrial coenzyme A transporter SLC25A42 [Venturia canescens]